MIAQAIFKEYFTFIDLLDKTFSVTLITNRFDLLLYFCHRHYEQFIKVRRTWLELLTFFILLHQVFFSFDFSLFESYCLILFIDS